MNKINLAFFTIILATSFMCAQHAEEDTIYFASGKSDLSSNSNERLKKTLARIQDKKNIRVTVIGYTDSDGNETYNNALSKSRALTIANFFIAHGIEKRQMTLESYGEQKPIASNESADGRQKNRRVEISIEKNARVKSTFFTKFDKEAQNFKVSANEDIVIKGREGTIISIPKNSLVNKNGEQINVEVEIELKEYYNKSDMILSNLHTMSGSEILETAGMIYISAKYAGEALKIKNGIELNIIMASKNKIEGMQTFNGEQHGDQMNWTQRTDNTTMIVENQTAIPFDGYENYERDSATTKKLARVDKMLIKSANLGWINCDRFYKYQSRTQLIIEIDTIYKPVVRLVFKDINAIMPAYYTKEKKVILSNIPVGQKATIIAFAIVDDKHYFAAKDIIIGIDQEENLGLKMMTKDALEKEIRKLN